MSKNDIKSTLSETAKEIYDDVAKPTLKSVGNIIALPFRAIDAALSPIKRWIDTKNYNYEQTRQLLGEKLKNVDETKIVEPEAYVAVPALQQLSYSYDSEELRKMYANLLASSMVDDTKYLVHPSFVDIIKQLLPIEAKTLNFIQLHPVLPIVNIRFDFKNGTFTDYANDYCIDLIGLFSNEKNQAASLKNLQRLGLINIRYDQTAKPDSLYDKFQNDKLYTECIKNNQNNIYVEIKLTKGLIELTDFGINFCNICCSNNYETA